MKRKKIISMLLVAAMAGTMLAGCGSSEEDIIEETSEAYADGESDEDAMFDEVQDINMYGLTFYGDGGLDEVMDAINAISEEKINVHVNYTPMDIGTYMEQMGLMLAGGESVDLMMATLLSSVDFTTMQSQNELMDISGYLEDYAPDLMDLMEDYISAMTVDDSIYGVPSYRIYNSSAYIIMRKDILDELGLTEQAEAISSWSDFEEILLAVKAAQDTLPPEMQTNAMICSSDGAGNILTSASTDVAADAFADNYGFDVLGDSNTQIIYVDENGQVGNYYATDDYRTSIERVIDWYNEGIVHKDAATTTDAADTLMMDGVSFSYVCLSEVGVEAVKSAATGYDVVCIDYCDIPIQTSSGNSWGWCVPVTSSNPEAAVAFMNLMYTDPEIENLFVYGIEGRDYELNDEGEAVILDTAEYQSSDFFYGNQFLAYPAEGNGGNFREEAMENMLAAEISPYYGCVVNTDPISNELTALSNVINQYKPALESGSVDISQLDVMLDAMDAAGVQTVVDYYQQTLDDWLAKQ